MNADANYCSWNGGEGQPITVFVQDVGDGRNLIDERSYYLDGDMTVTNLDHVMPPIWDDDEYIPPVYYPETQPVEDDDDTVSIVARTTAAVVATLMAAFLIIDRKN